MQPSIISHQRENIQMRDSSDDIIWAPDAHVHAVASRIDPPRGIPIRDLMHGIICGGEPERACADGVLHAVIEVRCEIWFEREVEFGEWQVAEGGPLSTLSSAFVVNQNIPKLDYYHCLALYVLRHVS